MEILTADQHRLLAFVQRCDESGYLPRVSDAELWLAAPRAGGAEYEYDGDMFGGLRLISKNYHRGALLKEPEPATAHLARLGWLEIRGEGDQGVLSLTDLGRALLRGAERAEIAEPRLSVVVFKADNPLAYPQMVGHLAGLGDGILVDPFLGVEQLHELVLRTQLSRFLISDRPSAARKRAAIGTYLRGSGTARPVEVRAASGFHDRVVLGAKGSFTLGTSLNGVGTTTTVLTPLPPAAADALRAETESIWSGATPLVEEANVEVSEDPAAQ
jgi:hypothetical protein